jgi:hypothetical protein
MMDDRGAIQLTDAVLSLFVLVAILALAPHFSTFTSMVASEADPFSSILLQLVVPGLLIGLILSIGTSARRGG